MSEEDIDPQSLMDFAIKDGERRRLCLNHRWRVKDSMEIEFEVFMPMALRREEIKKNYKLAEDEMRVKIEEFEKQHNVFLICERADIYQEPRRDFSLSKPNSLYVIPTDGRIRFTAQFIQCQLPPAGTSTKEA